jgi:uncharacterized protein (TIGR00725 family)
MGANDCATEVEKDAFAIGAEVAKQGLILLTGGDTGPGTHVKCASMRGAAEAGKNLSTPARLVGILGEGPRKWDTSRHCSLFLHTGIGGIQRDPITGVAPDALIFFGGSSGTLTELTFAAMAGKPVLFWKAITELKRKHSKHMNDGELDRFLTTALAGCHKQLDVVKGITSQVTVNDLKECLNSTLSAATDYAGKTEDLVSDAAKLAAGRPAQSDFPGFRDDQNSKAQFEEVISRISQCA